MYLLPFIHMNIFHHRYQGKNVTSDFEEWPKKSDYNSWHTDSSACSCHEKQAAYVKPSSTHSGGGLWFYLYFSSNEKSALTAAYKIRPIKTSIKQDTSLKKEDDSDRPFKLKC